MPMPIPPSVYIHSSPWLFHSSLYYYATILAELALINSLSSRCLDLTSFTNPERHLWRWRLISVHNPTEQKDDPVTLNGGDERQWII
jgi:hypothetical protein